MTEKHGFQKAGLWKFDKNRVHKVNFSLTKFERERVVYAFIVKDEVKYIGICEDDKTTLEKRMDRYRTAGKTRRTGWRLIGLIKKCLREKNDVLIYALKPEQGCKYHDLDIDLVKGLENPLNRIFKPSWSKRL